MRYRVASTWMVSAFVTCFATWANGQPSGAAGPANAPAASPAFDEPVVARLQMHFKLDDQIVETIEKGDLLTVVKAEGDNYLVTTFNGKKGWVQKVNAVKLAEAVEVYDDMIAEAPKEGRLYTLRASAWWARGSKEKALADFDQAINAGYKEPHAYTSRGLFYAAMEKYDQAIADYAMAIERGTKDESPYINRAAVYVTLKKYDLALKDYDAAIKMNGKRASTYQQRAVTWKLKGELDRSVQDFGEAIKLEPKYTPAWMGRGFAWFQMGNYQKAVDDFTDVIKLAPKSAQAYNNRGYNRQMMGDFTNALADYEQAIRLVPEFALAHQNRAWLLAACDDAKLRDGKKAVEAATKACELNNYKYLPDLKALAAAHAENKEFEKAIGWQEKAVELAPAEQKDGEREILKKYQARVPFRFADLVAANDGKK